MFQTIYIIFLICYLYLILINPGIPSFDYIKMIYRIRNNEIINDSVDSKHYKWCSQCGIYNLTQDKVKHCDKCNICISNHCTHSKPLGRCIGDNNWLVYYVFIIISLLLFFVETSIFFGKTNKK